MIGRLPTSVTVNGKSYDIRSDFRNILIIFQVMNDEELTAVERIVTITNIFFKDEIPAEEIEDAYKQLLLFINCGVPEPEHKVKKPSLYDWKKDEQIIFSAINKVAGKEVRFEPYMHWWTFMGLFNEIGEGMFNTVISIRSKKAKGQRLDKWEQEFCRNNKDMIDLPKHYTEEEQAQIDALNEILGQL